MVEAGKARKYQAIFDQLECAGYFEFICKNKVISTIIQKASDFQVSDKAITVSCYN